MGYDDTDINERRHPDRDDLDAVSREHPVGGAAHLRRTCWRRIRWRSSWPVISAAMPDPEGGRIRRRENGEPTGVLEETAMTPVFMRLPQPSLEVASEQLLTALECYASFGATTAQEALCSSPRSCRRQGRSGCRAVAAGRHRLPDVRSRLTNDGCGGNGGRFRLGGMKLTTDGSIQGYTAYLSRPFHVPPEGRDDAYAGVPDVRDAGEAERRCGGRVRQRLAGAGPRQRRRGDRYGDRGGAGGGSGVPGRRSADDDHPRADGPRGPTRRREGPRLVPVVLPRPRLLLGRPSPRHLWGQGEPRASTRMRSALEREFQ